jgi:hypothetical protein
MSLQAVLARISEIQGAMAPVQPTQPAAPAAPAAGSGSGSFAGQLQSAMTGGTGTADPGTVDPSSSAAAAPAAKAAPGSYPHLDGDVDANPEILQRLEALAAKKGMHFHITSGLRTIAEQQRLWDNRAHNPFPVARPGTSRHQSGRACDVTIGGRPIQSVISAAELRAAGLNPLAGDAVHVELP